MGEGRVVNVKGCMIAVFRSRNGSVYATQATCPHRDGPLADGLLGGSTVICPLHSRRFDLESGRSLSGECDLRTYPIYLDDNDNLILRLDGTQP